MKLTIKRTTLIKFLGFCAGLGSMLFVPTPFGRVAIFDLFCFIFCFLLISKWSYLSKPQRTVVYLSLLWVFSAILSNIMNAVPVQVNFKNSMIVFNVTCMLVCSFILLNRSREAFIWFIIGNGISGVLSFFILPNGAFLYFAQNAGYTTGNLAAFLIGKQVYPIYTDAIIKSVLFPLALFSSLSMVIINFLILITGFFLLSTGSRSSFGIYFGASIIGLALLIKRRLVDTILRRSVLTIIVFFVGGYMVFQTYGYLARSGKLGDSEKRKYESQFVKSGLGLFGGRNEYLFTSIAVLHRPLFGLGASRIDRWGIIEAAKDNYGSKIIKQQFDSQIPAHSVIMGAWVENGLGGGVFWIYVLVMTFQFIRLIPLNFPRHFPFYLYLYIGLVWGILFSPFGMTRGLYCVLIAYALIMLEENRRDKLSSEIYS